MSRADDELTGAWQQLCERLSAIGTRLGTDPFPASGPHHVHDVRHLTRQLVLALQGELEHADRGGALVPPLRGALGAMGRPEPRQRLYARRRSTHGDVSGHGQRRRSARAAIFSLVEGDMHLGRYGVFAEQTLADFDVPADGALELWIAPDHDDGNGHDGNWLLTHPDARYLLVRQYQCDWERDRIATLSIERTDARGAPPAESAASDLAAALTRAGDWVERSVDYWCK